MSEPTWELTGRGLAVAVGLVATVMGSAVVTMAITFFSVSNAPLGG